MVSFTKCLVRQAVCACSLVLFLVPWFHTTPTTMVHGYQHHLAKNSGVGTKAASNIMWMFMLTATCPISTTVLAATTRITQANIKTAVNAWIKNSTKAKLIYGHISQWNTSLVTDMSGLFSGSPPSFTSVTGSPNKFNDDISRWNTAKVTNMSRMFYLATNFSQPIGSWNTAKVTDMSFMFDGATNFCQPVGRWNTAKVTDMSFMFGGATKFNQPIGSWNTAKVTDMSRMFSGATKFNQPIGSWNTSNVISMATMFAGATNFNQPIGSWNTAKVIYMMYMFYSATNFNQPIGSWNTAKVTDMSHMFFESTKFNQPIGSWNTANVTDMSFMFGGATKFNQKLCWHLEGLTSYSNMFVESGGCLQPSCVHNAALVGLTLCKRSASPTHKPSKRPTIKPM